MGKFRIEIEELADEQLKIHYRAGNQASIKKIAKILKELTETPFE
jgi:toxin YoeB